MGQDSFQYLTSYLVNDVIAIDAGAIGFYQGPVEQAAIRDVFLSHTHIDHIASLSIFLENVAGFYATPVTLHASEAVQESLRLDIFNGRVWPNFLELTHENGRFVNLATIADSERIEVAGVRITPISVNHVVPTFGFILEDETSAVVITSDTGPTELIWERARGTPNLKAVFLECTFPNDMAALAERTKHLTPIGFLGEMQKLAGDALFFAVHLRARCRDQVIHELLESQLPNLQIAKFGKPYSF
jgi:ribonuclease BN (tRNA processing enzyme)